MKKFAYTLLLLLVCYESSAQQPLFDRLFRSGQREVLSDIGLTADGLICLTGDYGQPGQYGQPGERAGSWYRLISPAGEELEYRSRNEVSSISGVQVQGGRTFLLSSGLIGGNFYFDVDLELTDTGIEFLDGNINDDSQISGNSGRGDQALLADGGRVAVRESGQIALLR